MSNCPVEAMTYMKYKLARDSKSMPAIALQAGLPGVPPRLDPQQVCVFFFKLYSDENLFFSVFFEKMRENFVCVFVFSFLFRISIDHDNRR